MEIIWKNGVGFKFTLAPRFALGVTGLVVAAVSVPDHLPGLASILRAAGVGY